MTGGISGFVHNYYRPEFSLTIPFSLLDDLSDGCVDAGTSCSTCVSPVNLLLSNLDQHVQSTSAKADVHSDVCLCHSMSPVPSLTPPSPSSLTVPSVSVYHENSGIL